MELMKNETATMTSTIDEIDGATITPSLDSRGYVALAEVPPCPN